MKTKTTVHYEIRWRSPHNNKKLSQKMDTKKQADWFVQKAFSIACRPKIHLVTTATKEQIVK